MPVPLLLPFNFFANLQVLVVCYTPALGSSVILGSRLCRPLEVFQASMLSCSANSFFASILPAAPGVHEATAVLKWFAHMCRCIASAIIPGVTCAPTFHNLLRIWAPPPPP
eukprot:368857-Pelagomonas_calceolata.AAC.12